MFSSLQRRWQRFQALPNEHPAKTLTVMSALALACALLISFSVVSLRPLQAQHQTAQREAQLSEMFASLPGLGEWLRSSGADAVEHPLIELASGEPASADLPDFDWRKAIDDPTQCQPIGKADDLAGIGCRPLLARVYLVRREGKLALLVLPIYGKGYQSTLHALLVLDSGLDTIVALQVQEQGETPGLGSRVTDPTWLSGFAGRRLRDSAGVWRFAVRRQINDPEFEVDAIAGATRSSSGLGKAIEFWLGPLGYGPLLDRLAREATP